jgi:endoglucanase
MRRIESANRWLWWIMAAGLLALGPRDTQAGDRPLIERLGNGINTDFGPLGGPAQKVVYDPAYFTAARAAGFESVRFFIGATANPGVYEPIVRDGLDRGLVVVLCLWANDSGPENFVAAWEAFARHYRDFPPTLVFELFNEPKGSKVTNEATAVSWLNAAIPAIRRIQPTRLLLLGGPEWNQIEKLDWLNPDRLDYRLLDGTGFADDTNLVGVCHYYEPFRFTHSNGERVRLGEQPYWREGVTRELDRAAAWSAKWNKPVVMTEWGAQTAPKERGDLLEYVRFLRGELKRRQIGSLYYCGPFSNEWGFSIYDSERGWDAEVVESLTGIRPPAVPPANPLLNPEFDLGLARWQASAPAQVAVVGDAGLSGGRALKFTAADGPGRVFVFQETDLAFNMNDNTYRYSGKSLLSLREGRSYQIGMLARAGRPGAQLRVRLQAAGGNGIEYWASLPATLATTNQAVQFEYAHRGPDAPDVRLTLCVEAPGNEVWLDRVQWRSVATPVASAPAVPTKSRAETADRRKI